MTTQPAIQTQTYETNVEGIPPGQSSQLMYRWSVPVRLENLVIDPGLELVEVRAAKLSLKPNPDGTMPEWGQRIEPMFFVTVICKNKTDAIIYGKAIWTVSGSNLPAATMQMQTGYVPSKEAAARLKAQSSVPTQPVPRASTPVRAPRAPIMDKSKRSITPGRNEVAVLFSYGQVQRLMSLVNNCSLSDVTQPEKFAYLKCFNQGIDRFNCEKPLGEEELAPAPFAPALPAAADVEDRALFRMGYERAIDDVEQFVRSRAAHAYDRQAEEIRKAFEEESEPPPQGTAEPSVAEGPSTDEGVLP